MKIVHMVPALFDPRLGILGGAERYAFELARHMAKVIQTRLVSFGEQAFQTTSDSLEIHILKAKYICQQRFNPFSFEWFRHLRGADVIHCHQQHILASSLSAVFARLTGKKIYVTDLGGGGLDFSSYGSTDRWYHGHLHISQYSRHIAGHDGCPWAHVIYGGVDTEKFSPEAAQSKTNHVLFVGRLLPHKGIDVLIQALPSGMTLEVIGQPMDQAYLKELEQLAQGKKVLFRFDCNDEQLVDAYRRALCVVLPSVYRDCHGHETKIPELLGQTLLEGMACGIPAIGTDVASLPEVIEDGMTGYIVPSNQPGMLRKKIQQLAADLPKANRLGKNGRERVMKKFSWGQVVGTCLSIYSAGLNQKPERA